MRLRTLVPFLVTALFIALTPSARAAEPPELITQFSEWGTGAGQSRSAPGIATSPVDGHVYLAEGFVTAGLSNPRISEYSVWGEFIKAWGWGVLDGSPELQTCSGTCERGVDGSGAGQFVDPNGIAIDSSGNVYVFDLRNLRVQKFTADGEFLLMFGGGVNQGPHNPGNVCTAANLAEGDVCGAGSTGTGPGEFTVDVTGTANGNYIAVGPADQVYVADKGRIQEFDSGGNHLDEFELPDSGYESPTANNPGALAVDPLSGDLYFSFDKAVAAPYSKQPDIYRFDPTGNLVDKIDAPVPVALATDTDGNVYAVEDRNQNAGKPLVTAVVAYAPDGTSLIPQEAEFATPPPASFGETRLVGIATNVVGDVLVSAQQYTGGALSYVSLYGPAPVELEPPPPAAPQITEQFAAAVEESSAVVRAKVNPKFWIDTRYYVEYGTEPCESSTCSQVPASPGSLLGGKAVSFPILTAGITLPGLEPDTTYHYRFVSASSGGGPTVGPERTFTTRPSVPPQPPCPGNAAFRTGAGAKLPDCRAYEMVSPVDKQGADIEVVYVDNGFPAGLDRSAEDGESLTYSAYRAFANPQSAPYSSQYLAARGASGWANESISPRRAGPSLYETDGLDSQFKVFTPDLCFGGLLQDADYSLAPGSVAGFANLYTRENCAGGTYRTATVTEPSGVEPLYFYPEIQGMSADGSRMVFRTDGGLTADGTASKLQLYEAHEGDLKLVCVRPSGVASKEPCSAGYPSANRAGRRSTVADAMSEDGRVVYWTEALAETGRLFARVDGTETVSVSEGLAAQYLAAATDGSRALFAEAGVLYEFDLATEEATEVAPGFKGLLGASDDALSFYFVSTADLAGAAVEGSPNLYLREADGDPRYVATLAEVDVKGLASPVSPEPMFHFARVSADGSAAAFISRARPGLTGFDNTDVASGEADAEVYLYDAEAEGGAGLLRCVSCLTTGARPSGRNVRDELNVKVEDLWMAARIPTAENQLYAPEVLTDDGSRLYFESFDALSPDDTNSQLDVYQWEEAGTGGCAVGVPGYLDSLTGCVNLISSGESEQASRIVDVAAGGRDVFFTTLSSLVEQDPGLVDVYDARAGGGFPPPPQPAPECQGESCQQVPPAPPATNPSSATFQGPGNLKPKGVRKCPKGKHKIKRKGKVRCVKNKKKGKAKRANKRHREHSRGRAGR